MNRVMDAPDIIALSHDCNRNPNCECQPFVTSALSSFLSDNDPSILTSTSLREAISRYCPIPEVHLPFKSFANWMQAELYIQHFGECEKYIHEYIIHSKLAGAKLPLSKEEYCELMEILIFHCIYIYKGYDIAHEFIEKDKVIDENIKKAFMKRLNELDGRPIEEISVNEIIEKVSYTEKLKNILKVILIKHKWKIFAAFMCLVFWGMMRYRFINKVNLFVTNRRN